MPSSSPFSLRQLTKNRFVRIVICFVIFSPIFWLVYVKGFARFSNRGSGISRNATVQGRANASIVPDQSAESSEGTQIPGGESPRLRDRLGNFEPADEPPKSGPGEGGKPYRLPSDQFHQSGASTAMYGMNMLCSDGISLDRSIPDLRDEECKHWDYPENLPNASVIIVFHNEGFSVLMRTVHSVINRTPPQFLAEVLLVDDHSDKEDLKHKLESYIQRWQGKVRLIRNAKREGLINTRSRGAREALGEVIVFLDAHCEVNKNWLPPLLTPISENRKTMTVPIIDGIDSNHFAVRPVYKAGHLFKGIFEWGMLYKEKELTREEMKARAHSSLPYRSPTHAGGLFAISKEYFLELGAYDPGLLVWGGENFELSFKIWQCGGSILWVPCSRVAHVYKSIMPYSFGDLAPNAKGPVITINYKRVVETWMDDKYKEFFYTREPVAKFYDMGNITDQLELKNRLQCKSFQWFMDNVAPDLTTDFPELPPNVHWGHLQNIGANTCVDSFGFAAPSRMTDLRCKVDPNDDQLLRLNARGQLGMGERCVIGDEYGVKLDYCRLGCVSGPWRYNEKTQLLYNSLMRKCMAVTGRYLSLELQPCNNTDVNQKWKFNEVHP